MRPRALLLPLALAACSGPPATPPAPAPSAAAAPAPTAPAPTTDGVTLLSPGAEPRTTLRYAVPDQTIRHLAWQMTVAGQSTALAWQYTFQRKGDAMSLSMRILDKGPFAGIAGQWAFNDRGRHAAAASDARTVLQQTQAEHMLPILPAEPVGVGATWSVPTSISAGVGVGEMPGHTRWDLLALDGSTASLRGTLDAPETSLPFRDTVMKASARGSLDARIDLAAFTADTTLKMVIDVAGTPSESTLTMQVR